MFMGTHYCFGFDEPMDDVYLQSYNGKYTIENYDKETNIDNIKFVICKH